MHSVYLCQSGCHRSDSEISSSHWQIDRLNDHAEEINRNNEKKQYGKLSAENEEGSNCNN